MKRKLRNTVIAVACVIATNVCITNSSVNAANSDWGFTTGSSGSGFATSGIKKTDTSSVYMYCSATKSASPSVTTSNASFRGTAYGSATVNGTYSNQMTGKRQYSQTYTFYKGTTRYMTNYIYEALINEQHKSSCYAKVHYKNASGYISFSGRWRPNS